MKPSRRTVSIAAERAVRYLSERNGPVASVELARGVLSTRLADESVATRLLETAFAGDDRLAYDRRGWRTVRAGSTRRADAPAPDPPRVLILVRGRRPARGRSFEIRNLVAVRVEGDSVVAACGGAPSDSTESELRRATLEMLADGAVPVLHDPPGALAALEAWLDEPLEAPVSLRRLARSRLDLPASHDLETLAGRLGLPWCDSEDEALEQAETLEACLRALRRPGEPLEALRGGRADGVPAVDWSRFAFDRAFLRELPHVAGTYRFYDRNGRLLYVGKSRNLRARVSSYFSESSSRPPRVQKLLDALHRIEVEPVGSDLEAMLREAAQIRRQKPERNVQRGVHPKEGRARRLQSILILEPASRPWVLRAYLLRDGRLVGKVNVGPRGAGLRRIERLLDDHFFGIPVGPTVPAGPSADVEVEVVSRWLGSHRDRVVAFDPTNLGSSREVIRRLRWFLRQGSLLEPDGTPILIR